MMDKEYVQSWKKVYEENLPSLVIELNKWVIKPCVLILTGPVGAGKTTFTKYFVPHGNIQSQTYSIVNEEGGIAYADFYRIKNPEEVIHLELPLYLDDKDIFLVEWGIDHLTALRREVPEDFHFFEMVIETPPNSEETDQKEQLSRNFYLYQLH